jgi:uncharacterized protein YdaU (DUF1376 family)
MIGHNSASYGQEIDPPVETILGDDHKKLFHYVQWNLADYITGTQGMTPEQEGVYMRFLVRLYDRGKPLPDDDRFMSSIMGLDIRRWRRARTDLVAFGKIIVRAGALTNARFEKERLKRAEELQKQAEATRKYWEKRRAEKATSEESRAEVGAKSAGLPRDVSEKCDEKPNEINEIDEHPNRHTRKSRVQNLKEEERKEETPLDPPEGEKPKRVCRMPEGWQPADKTLDWAKNGTIGASADQIANQFEHFRDYHLAKGSKFADWERAFQTWMRNAKQYGRLDQKKSTANESWSRSGSYIGELL